MNLMLPDTGLLFWMTVIFAIVLFILASPFYLHVGLGQERSKSAERLVFLGLVGHRIIFRNQVPTLFTESIAGIIHNRIVIQFSSQLFKHVFEKYPAHILDGGFIRRAKMNCNQRNGTVKG